MQAGWSAWRRGLAYDVQAEAVLLLLPVLLLAQLQVLAVWVRRTPVLLLDGWRLCLGCAGSSSG